MGSGAVNGHQASATTIGEVSKVPSQGSIRSGALSSRRSFRERLKTPLQVVTRRDILSNLSILTRVHNDHVHPEKRRIQWTDSVAERLALGAPIFPSSHPEMQVLYGMKKNTGERVVVKVRQKRGSFANQGEEAEWRMSTEFMLNLPKSGNIVQLYEVLEDTAAYYVVMEKATGQDLFETLDCHGRLPLSDCKEILRQLLAAVAELHAVGCIHKDLKLENVMIDRASMTTCNSWHSMSTDSSNHNDSDGSHSPVVKLIDFDTVEAWAPGGHRLPESVVGTDQYIAQEAYAGKYSPASDIFAVGVIAYKLLTGRFPFSSSIFDDEAGENWVGSPKMNQIRSRLRHFPIDFNVGPLLTDVQARDFCMAMLAVDDRDRPKAAAALQHPFLSQAKTQSPTGTATSLGSVSPGSSAPAADYLKGTSKTPRSTANMQFPYIPPQPSVHLSVN